MLDCVCGWERIVGSDAGVIRSFIGCLMSLIVEMFRYGSGRQIRRGRFDHLWLWLMSPAAGQRRSGVTSWWCFVVTKGFFALNVSS